MLEVDDPPYPFGHELFKEVAPAEALVSAPKRALHEYFDDLGYLPTRKLKLFGANLFPGLFGLPKEFDLKAYEQNRTDFTTNFPGETGEVVNMDNAVPRKTLLEQASQQTDRTAWTNRQYARLNGGADRIYIQKIADEAKARGVQLIFSYMPMFNGPEKASQLDFVKQYGVVINNGDLASRDELFEIGPILTTPGHGRRAPGLRTQSMLWISSTARLAQLFAPVALSVFSVSFPSHLARL